jgi:amino acid permease
VTQYHDEAISLSHPVTALSRFRPPSTKMAIDSQFRDRLPSISIEKPSVHQTSHSHSSFADDEHLARLGKRPMLTRSFGFMSMLGLSCSALLSWEGVLVTSVPGLLNGGSAGVIWGFLISWAGLMSVYGVMAELASIAPTAGGQCTLASFAGGCGSLC